MAQLSKKQLHQDIEERLFEILWSSLTSLPSKTEAERFFTDLLSPTEKMMVAKRLGIALMLSKKKTYSSIVETLKVSTTTITMVNHWLKGGNGGYEQIVNRIRTNEEWESLWSSIDEFIARITIVRPGTDWSKAKSREWAGRAKRKRKLNAL